MFAAQLPRSLTAWLLGRLAAWLWIANRLSIPAYGVTRPNEVTTFLLLFWDNGGDDIGPMEQHTYHNSKSRHQLLNPRGKINHSKPALAHIPRTNDATEG